MTLRRIFSRSRAVYFRAPSRAGAPPQVDTQVPSVPQGVLANAPTSQQVTVTWQASTDNVGVTGYRVYRDGTAIADTPAGTLVYIDTSVSPASNYTYTVSAFDAAGNFSDQSATAGVRVPEIQGTVEWAPFQTTLPAGTRYNVLGNLIDPNSEVIDTEIRQGADPATAPSIAESGDGSYNPTTGFLDFNDGASTADLWAVAITADPQTANVSTATELRDAVAAADPGDTIVCASGTYTLPLGLTISTTNLTIRSQSGDPDDVIIEGDAMLPTSFGHDPSQLPPGYNGPYAAVGNIFDVNANGFTLLDVTLRRCGFHALQIRGELNGGVNNGRVENVKIRDCYEQFIKVSGTLGNTNPANNPGARNWVIRNVDMRFESPILSSYNGGIDAHLSSGWLVDRCTFEGFQAPPAGSDYAQGIFQGIMEHGVHIWDGSFNNTIQNCFAKNCDRGFGYWDPQDSGGNNMFNNVVFVDLAGELLGYRLRDSGRAVYEPEPQRLHHDRLANLCRV